MTPDQAELLTDADMYARLILWVAAAASFMFLIIRLWPIVVKFVNTVNALNDLPTKLALLDDIHHEVRPNTGTSMNDAIRRTEARVQTLEARLTEQSEKIDGLQELMEAGDTELAERVNDLENTLTPRKGTR